MDEPEYLDVHRALTEALCDPDLASPGGCQYVSSEGKRCIIGTVLHRAGVSDEKLTRNLFLDGRLSPNSTPIMAREDLRLEINRTFGPRSRPLLQAAQRIFDSSSEATIEGRTELEAVRAYVRGYYAGRASG